LFVFFSSSDHFYQYGEIRSVTVVPKQSCAFVQFTQREAAERAAKETFNNLVIDGKRLTVKWGKPPSAQGSTGRGNEASAYEASYEPVPGLPSGTILKLKKKNMDFNSFFFSVVPLPANELKADFFGLSSTSNVGATASATTFLPPPPPPADLGDYTSSLSYGHISHPLRGGVHYPSQDPSRVGSTASHGKSNE